MAITLQRIGSSTSINDSRVQSPSPLARSSYVNDDIETQEITTSEIQKPQEGTSDINSVSQSVEKFISERAPFLKKTKTEIENEFKFLPFELIDDSSPEFSDVPYSYENREKNRYCNILPNEATRVVLNNGGYVNANHCLGRRVILSQGPTSNTVEDFWGLAWDTNSTVIAMLTDFIENGRIKCDEYFPKKVCETKTFGRFTVSCIEPQENPLRLKHLKLLNIIPRTFILDNGTEERTVKHYHFLAWPDHGYSNPERVAALTRILLSAIDSRSLPIIHCSAGVGRSGVISTIVDTYSLSLEGFKYRSLVPERTTLLRTERRGAVQSLEQYEGIYHTLNYLLEQDEVLTKITVRCPGLSSQDVLTVRGKGGGLEWTEGVAMKNIGNDTYVYEIEGLTELGEYKILLNDNEREEASSNHEIEPGKPQMIDVSFSSAKRNAFFVHTNIESERLFVRGTGPGMSWEKGIELKKKGDDEFVFEFDAPFDTFECKLLLNDEQWEFGENRIVEKGKPVIFSPIF